MLDLNDFFYFVQVVDRGGFTAAGRTLRVPKSTLSHRLQQLEGALGVRLLNRTSRRFGMTDAGEDFYRHAVAMLREAELAETTIRQRLTEPTGTVRCTAGVATMQFALGHIRRARVGVFRNPFPSHPRSFRIPARHPWVVSQRTLAVFYFFVGVSHRTPTPGKGQGACLQGRSLPVVTFGLFYETATQARSGGFRWEGIKGQEVPWDKQKMKDMPRSDLEIARALGSEKLAD